MCSVQQSNQKRYSVQDFLPLICIVSVIGIFTVMKQYIYGWNVSHAMTDFMGAFFVVFGLFKMMNLHGFVSAYRMYDIIAKYSAVYAYVYPFIEVFLGVAYLARYQLMIINGVTMIVMVVSSIGVAQELARSREITCACLGAVFKIPMTYVTLAEDLVMAIMALIMLIM